MSKYTVEYGTLYDSGFAPLLEGLEYYPIFDESHREELNRKIYNRYKFREIGFETVAVFTHYFITLINEIMPFYNELYRTAARDYDFLSDADLTETENVATNSSSSGTSNSSSNDSKVPELPMRQATIRRKPRRMEKIHAHVLTRRKGLSIFPPLPIIPI